MGTKCKSHFFMLPPPDGRESIGVCKYCGLEQTHYNSFENKFNGRVVKKKEGNNGTKVGTKGT